MALSQVVTPVDTHIPIRFSRQTNTNAMKPPRPLICREGKKKRFDAK
jgi:hypothetical protein